MPAQVKGARQISYPHKRQHHRAGPTADRTLENDVSVDEQPVRLSAREYALLMHLAMQPGIVISPEELVQATHKFKAYDDEAGTLIRPLDPLAAPQAGIRGGRDGLYRECARRGLSHY